MDKWVGSLFTILFPGLNHTTSLKYRQTKDPVSLNARALRTQISNYSKVSSTQNAASQTPHSLKPDQNLEMSQVTLKQPKLSVEAHIGLFKVAYNSKQLSPEG